MRFQKRVHKSTCTTFPFGPSHMYNIEAVDIVFLSPLSISYRIHLRTDAETECPSSCSQPFIPTKLGTPLKLGVPFKLGIESTLLVSDVGPKIGLAIRRLLLRRAMALWIKLKNGTISDRSPSYPITPVHFRSV